MAADNNLDEDDGITGINVTPLVDVMLVLLVIFMVTANYINKEAINLKLPKAATGESPGTVNLAFALDKQSRLYLDGNPVNWEELADKVQAEKAKGKSVRALISADEGTPHGSVIKLMDSVRKNGITDIAFNVEVEVESSAQ